MVAKNLRLHKKFRLVTSADLKNVLVTALPFSAHEKETKFVARLGTKRGKSLLC